MPTAYTASLDLQPSPIRKDGWKSIRLINDPARGRNETADWDKTSKSRKNNIFAQILVGAPAPLKGKSGVNPALSP